MCSYNQEAAGNSTGNTTTGNATAGNISAIMVPAEEEEPFDLQSWLRTKPSGTWSEFINSHPEQGDFDLSGISFFLSLARFSA